jgi:hypothetical protein
MSHHNPTYKDKFTDVHQKLLQEFSHQLIHNPSKKADVKLAAAIISGQIDGHRFAAGLLRILGSMLTNQHSNTRRHNAGQSLPNVSGEDFSEIAFTLAGLMRNKSGMRMFGISERHCKPLQLSHPRLPDFYMSLVNPQMLQQGTSRALANLKVADTRNYFLAFDETAIGQGR